MDRALELTDSEFTRIHTYLKRKYGVDMSRKREIIAGRLENYLAQRGYTSYTEYMDAVERDASGTLERELVDKITTNHTYFMREFTHFDYYRDTVLPEMRAMAERSKDLHIWCGASSSGEEPYTIAMVTMDYFGYDKKNWDTKILATDVSTAILKQAMQGIYTAEQMENVPDSWKKRFFKASPDKSRYMASDELKQEVLFRQFNLMDPFPFKKQMHVIFLRNVMIYFDDKTKRELTRKLYDQLLPGGYLFIGQTETIDRDQVPFHLVKPSVYKKC